MKLFTAAFLALAATVGLNAESVERMTLKFPTPVVINGATLPAGDASISIYHNSGAVLLTVLSDSGQSASVLVNRIANNEEASQPSVVLDKVGDQYRLNRIMMTDHTSLQVLDAR